MPTLREGDSGQAVVALQRELNEAGGLEGVVIKVDGDFGPITAEAVRAFQMRSVGPDGQPLLVDAVVGELTWWALRQDDQAAANTAAARFAPGHGPYRNALAERVVEVAMREMAAGARELGKNNAGEFVEKYLNGIQGAWCAGFISWCVETAARELNAQMPFNYTGGARNILKQLEAQGLAFDVGKIMGGDLMFWWREAPDSWKGHVELVTHVNNGVIFTIGGNRGRYPAPVRRFSYVREREQKFLSFGKLGA